MNQGIKYCLVLILGISTPIFADSMDNNNYWQCTILDGTNQQWQVNSIYKKVALNEAYDACKKESQAPVTCKATQAACEQFINGISIKPMWQCTALDREAEAWPSNTHDQREDAALAAKAYCMENSNVPETCYINMVTCVNKNGFSADDI